MNAFEFNKIIGAMLGTVFVILTLGILSDAIFASPVPEKPGYGIEAAEEEAGGGEGGGAPVVESIIPLLATASVEAGEASHKKCMACHTVENGGANKTGPNLWNIVNRPVATHEGFSYSAALKEFSQGGATTWTYENLDHFLTSPKAFVKGTAMGFAGIKKTQERADLIAYLRTLSDNPAPLPDPAAAAPAVAPGGEQPAAAPASGEAPAGGEAPAAPAEAAPAQPAAPAN